MSGLVRDGSGGQRLRLALGSDAVRLVAATTGRTIRFQVGIVYVLAGLLLAGNIAAGAALIAVMAHQPEVRSVDQSGRVWNIPILGDEGAARLAQGRWVGAFTVTDSASAPASAKPGNKPRK